MSATAVTAPSKLCSQVKPTRTLTEVMIEKMARSAVFVSALDPRRASSTLSRPYTTKNVASDSVMASMMRPSIVCTSMPRSGFNIQAQRAPIKMHHAKAMAHVFMMTSTTRSDTLSSSSFSLVTLERIFAVRMEAVQKSTPTPQSARTCVRPSVKSIGSSRPSSLGSWPVMAKRQTCTVRKEAARLRMSFSASPTASCTSAALLPCLPASFASALKRSRKTAVPWNIAMSTSVVTSTGTKHRAGFFRKSADCCMEPPAAMAAKPAMCASSVAQHAFLRVRFSSSTFFLTTATSKPWSSVYTLLRASWSLRATARTRFSGTEASKLTSMASATVHSSFSRSTLASPVS
mmetsp:Transcript_133520/g.345617  ORF Transcript_133520/g.345617 Transcript_133520/m.345617 type:complete len:347 (+) Transcript_133520:333-1373(+)